MPRTKRICPADEVFHVLNRSVARMTLFEKPDDYAAFMRVVEETWQKIPIPIFAMSVMPNHWHFVVRPRTDTQLTEFFQRLTVTHTMRWHAHDSTGGKRSLKAGTIQVIPHSVRGPFIDRVMRYVERNPRNDPLGCRAGYRLANGKEHSRKVHCKTRLYDATG